MIIIDNFSLWLPAWIAGLLVLATHVPLGQRVLRQGVIFLDLAIAQAASVGVILAYILDLHANPMALQILALGCAMLMAIIFQFLARTGNRYLEAWIGCSFVLSATLGLWLLSGNAHAAEHLREILMGQILWVTPSHLAVTCLYYLFAAFLLMLKRDNFYLIFAICITAAVQLVGVYLVFATLIMPALATAGFKKQRNKIGLGYGLSILAYTFGILFSYYWDTPTSPMIVYCMALGMFSLLSFNFIKSRIHHDR